VSTVRRWERREGLPVHRHRHHKLGSVYAFPSEIDDWWHHRRVDRFDRRDEAAAQPAAEAPAAEAPGVQPAAEPPPATRRVARPALIALIVLTAGLMLIGALPFLVGAFRAPRTTAGLASIAVLPFKTAPGNPDAEILSDGLTDGIINSLSAVADLKVISHTSVFRFKGKDIVPKQAGRELGVRALLLGRVHRQDDRLLLAVELVDATDDHQIWGATYERRAPDLGALQETVVHDIVRVLTGREHVRKNRYADSTEAHELYLRGRHHWNKRTPEGFRRAVSAFSEAIDKNPAYAPAYAGLADSYTLMGYFYSVIPFSDARSKAKNAATTALALDDSLAEAHTSMASVMEYELWDWAGAGREYRRAIELAPNDANAHHWYANNLSLRDRHDEAIAIGRRAIELDPLSPIIHVALGHAYLMAHRYDEAIGQLKKALEIEPSFANAHQFLGLAYERKGMYERALTEMQTANSSIENWVWKAFLAQLYTRMDRNEEAMQIVTEFSARRPKASRVTTAALYAAVRERARPLALLQKACDERDPDIGFIKSIPTFDALRDDPAFQSILRRIGLS
jgi:TolB-like protein/tetratricopeptide (TPR) repeat protein